MRNRFVIPLIAAGLTVLTGCCLEDLGAFGDSERYTEDFHHSYPLQAGGRLTIENFNGAIEISSWNENSVQIDGSKYAATPELRDALRIEIDAKPDAVSIRTVRPSGLPGKTGAKFFIKVPRETRLERVVSTNGSIRASGTAGDARLRTTNGSIRAEALRGSLEAQTTNGGIEVHTQEGDAVVRSTNGRIRVEGLRGALEAFTTNGGITAEIAKSGARGTQVGTTNGSVDLTLDEAGAGGLKASTTNGGITVRLPDKVNARLVAHTTHAAVRSDFDVQGSVQKNHVEGVIGSGGPAYNLTTTNGGIRIARR